MGKHDHTQSLAEEEIHDILRNERRREVLDRLRKTIGSMSLRELSVSIAESESGQSPPPTDLRESVYNSLHQTHLPKLDREGIVVYDRDRKTVELDQSARAVDLYMEVVTPYGITWASFYRALCTIGLMVLLGVELGFPLLSALNSVLLITTFLLVLAAATSYQLWNRRWFILRALVE
ncbi:DUF7344 domain-containing protein [Halosimplex amylolyticum]|uniref:DUF7344 domain-containing protein n=1 Tax=Halosimplex amylolyticum TaxID=3396616 RepID=UPI003F54F899